MGERAAGTWTVVAAALALAGAAQAAHANPAPKPGEESGLGLFGPSVPEVLKHAKADPYAPPAEPACQSAPEELAALDDVLGPDADAPPEKKRLLQPTRWMTQAVRSAIPHRDVVQFLTGANKKRKALTEAEMAGWARRGYLKGVSRTLACTAPPAEAAATDSAAVEAAPAQLLTVEPEAQTIAYATPAPVAPPVIEPLRAAPEALNFAPPRRGAVATLGPARKLAR